MSTTTYRVQDRYEQIEFSGTLLADVSTETPDSDRWTEIRIYRTIAGSYVVERVGRSVIYHEHDGPCNTGVPVRSGDLDDMFTPCRRCQVADLDVISQNEMVDQELDKHQTDVVDAAGVQGVLTLQRRDHNRGENVSYLSNPALRALALAANADSALCDVRSHVRRVS